ncbi:hypothetical protein ASPVEDRAFT_23883 [Aspergillus versicolor CBS 583.65]|uniref:BIR-domain-containing protein n=1 Tax=Aspergillus versicolor CBS 583.65 TaxID=1036611 RepID=A0A1L9P640_ASPVE|nr:uncharacterized protein ASPVEDRAFT_23883 [Aspergillus versicolor CBS 583.65]OJI96904.1 hypothetical protein ASPVEDRAFT_23883 [Aspergillus versicolor CBS 583.65]
MANEMETFAARLATFDLVLHPDRRSSSSKSAKPITWPHQRPSPAELAHAGFFYNPYETNPDNTTCFLCRRALDGWEEEDNPITEHLKHAKDCGWAVMMDIQQRSSNPAEIEDPTSEAIAQARLTTFGESWPHDGKKGWLCQSDKMVEGGWYFCPNEESADLASCAYCKLSLDGWEPKDNPFDEHYRRSSDCSFFVFAKPAKGKGTRSKKGRTSKASRQSTQSTASEILPSDVEDQLDQSVSSQPAKAKSTKKSSKSKSKTSKSKKDEPRETESQMDVDEAEDAQPETSRPKRSTRGRKRSSTELDKDTMSIDDENTMDQPEPPSKKRATKRSTSRARAQSIMSTDSVTDVPGYESEATHDEEGQKTGRGRSKKKTAKGRKASSTSKSAPKSRLPRDSELEAAIEAGLEGDEPQKDEPQNMEIEDVNTEKTTSKPGPKKSKSKKKNAKKDPEPSNDAVDQRMIDNDAVAEQQDPEPEPVPVETQAKRRSSKNTADQPNTIPDQQLEAQDVEEEDGRRNESFVSVEIVSKPLAEYSQVETNEKESKKTKKKASSEKTKKSKKGDKADKKAKTTKTEETEMAEVERAQRPDKRESEQPEAEAEEQLPQASPSRTPEPSRQEHVEKEPSRRRSSKVPPKTAERYSDISQDKQYARSVASDRSPEDTRYSKQDQQEEPVSPLPSASRGTPSLSPQSSDAENHPPSMKASAPRAQLSSPSKNTSVRFPLGTSTPSPSKRNTSPGKLKSSHPWVPIDIDEILVASLSDKENTGLQSALGNLKGELETPEKKMTVEEWIMWNAKNGEERLKRECERLVGQFEKEGARAMRALEGIECVD